MKRNALSIAVFSLSTLAIWVARVPNAAAANPNEVVIFQCGTNTSTVYNYETYGGPGQTSGANCAEQLEILLNDGLTNVNVSVQTWSSDSGPPDSLVGTYITFVLSNGTLTSGGL